VDVAVNASQNNNTVFATLIGTKQVFTTTNCTWFKFADLPAKSNGGISLDSLGNLFVAVEGGAVVQWVQGMWRYLGV